MFDFSSKGGARNSITDLQMAGAKCDTGDMLSCYLTMLGQRNITENLSVGGLMPNSLVAPPQATPTAGALGSLSPEEKQILAVAIEEIPELMPILDKMTASSAPPMTEDGAVSGPGTETSDSVNARLSDGEFVFSAKAVKQMGVDKLRKQMVKAEEEYDAAMGEQTAAQDEAASEGAEGFSIGGLVSHL